MISMRPIALLLFTLLGITGCQQTTGPNDSQPTPATVASLWQLDTSKSLITYISTKNGDIQEHNSLQFLSGLIDADKQVKLIIDLNSIDTNIEIRDERMRELFFETEDHPIATVSAHIDNNLPLMTPYNITANLNFKGIQQTYQSPVIIHSGGGEMMVTSADPVTVSAETFGLQPALEKLREIAGLNSISSTVQVEFKLHFKQSK
ncbi:MAG: YceI family protein [Proteobacteria bacterium]|nr:MAG: YceI family protein [Pseudomonadota bacterium]